MDSEFQKTMERQKRAEELAEKVMCLARDNIVVNMRFLDVALSRLKAEGRNGLGGAAADGEKLYYDPVWLLKRYKEEPGYPIRLYLHVLFHYVFYHSFAYGEKENGAVFSHMTVMYANALYQRGFVKEGYKALHTLLMTAMNFETSKIYPGIPEYFDASGRGMYHYLTGAASWFMLTMITEVYGVKGNLGNLVLAPKLMAEQFDVDGNASIQLNFLKKRFLIRYHNPEKMTYGTYKIESAQCDDITLEKMTDVSYAVCLKKEAIESLDDTVHVIDVVLGSVQDKLI